MKIIQSFWSGNKKKEDENYGWHDSEFHWMGWILSVNQLIKYYDKVELYTDDFGYEILINQLKLPYTKVHVVLNELDHFPSELWALAKIKTYALQNEPFIHVDGDVFIWKEFPGNFSSASLIAQNIETATDYYFFTWNRMKPFLSYMPSEMQDFNINTSNLSVNMGITGGSDLLFFQQYAQRAFEFVEKNKQIWKDISLFNFNVFFEQVLFYRMAELKNIGIEYLFSQIWADNLYEGFGDFHLVPYQKHYLHLLGDFKRNGSICRAMEGYIMKFYPDFYSNLRQMLGNTEDEERSPYSLNAEMVFKLSEEFELEVKSNKFIASDFLLKRNINNVSLNELYNSFLIQNKDFKIVRLPGFAIVEKDEEKSLEIEESNSVIRFYAIDEVDELMLQELSKPEYFFDLLKKMKLHLEDQNDEEAIQELAEIIQRKIEIYITLKIVSIYSNN
ncbi:DUF6734 family protein [uncultured Flavobacterium sp.]|uniref:DUF6734 family protein n=1 Tax=uncultured Flavobacterium sp. TaxID=165435 RepID=UPI0025D7B5BB|nr:DUF6734 family protein [uncultured Flavobacterium sp.]